MKKMLKWVGIVLVGIVTLPIAALVLVNLFDEDLDPKAAAYGAPRAASVPEAENAYYAIIAMNASDGTDGMAYARAWHNEVKSAANENRKEKLPEPTRAKRPELCDSRHTACLSLIREKTGEVAQQLEAYKEDLARYETLLGYKRFEEVFDFQMRAESSLPTYAGWLNAQRAYLLRVGLDIEAGKLDEAMVALERELAFQRLVLGNSRSLLGKMVSAAYYWRALQFVNELLGIYADDLAPYMPRISALLQPLEPSALSIANWTEMEFGSLRETSQSYKSLEQQHGKVPFGRVGYTLFFKRNATLNRSYRFFSGIVPALNATADRIEGELEVYERNWQPTWDHIYNPVGKIMTNMAPTIYSLRLHDLGALNRLLALRVEMLVAGVGAEQVPAFIAKSDARFHNPYTRKPMSWDVEKKRLYFDAHSDYIRQLKNGVDGSRVFVAVSSEDDIFVRSVRAPGEKPENLDRARAAVGAGKRGHWDKAVQLYGEAIQFDNLSRTNLALAYRNRGRSFVSDKPDRAIEDLDKALRLNPNDYLAYLARGIVWHEKREYDRAIDDYTKALRLNPKHVSLYSFRATSWHDKREYDRAIEDYTQAIRLLPNESYYYSRRAEVWSDKREHERAIDDYTEALRLYPKGHSDYAARAGVRSNKREYEQAIDDYTQALQLDPKSHLYYFSRGVTQFHTGRPELAAQDFDHALALEPGNPMYMQWEYLALRRLGRDAAQALVHRATKLDPTTHGPSSVVLLFQGKIAPATLLARARSGDADVAKYMRSNAMFYLGHWHLLRGERTQAARSFHEVLVMCEKLRSQGSAASWLNMAFSAGGSLHTEFNAARAELLAMGERVD